MKQIFECSTKYCFGVLELVAQSSDLGAVRAQQVQKYQEKEMYHAADEKLLIYKCSCCQRMEYRANESLATRLNETRPINVRYPLTIREV